MPPNRYRLSIRLEICHNLSHLSDLPTATFSGYFHGTKVDSFMGSNKDKLIEFCTEMNAHALSKTAPSDISDNEPPQGASDHGP